MPLHVKSISVSLAVICFFGIAVITWISGLSPFTCCIRSLTAAAAIYVITAWAVKMVNGILINAIAKRQVEIQEENAGDSQN